MYEMTAAELDAELAIELPDRALMKKAKKATISVSESSIKHSVLIAANQQNKSEINQWAQGGTANANGGNATASASAQVDPHPGQQAEAQAEAQGGNGGTADASANNVAQVWQTNVIAVSNN